MFSSIYKDSNTLHLPTERFSPVRRFSDGAASIQAFKAHLEKMGNNSSIKQLQQVRGGWGPSKQPPPGILTASVLLLQEAKEESLHAGAVPALYDCSKPWVSSGCMSCSPAVGHLGAFLPPLLWGEPSCCAHPWVSCLSHQHCQTAAPALPHFLWQQFGAVPGCPRKGQLLSVLWDIPCTARHSLPMAGAGFGPRTGLSSCSNGTNEMLSSP